MVLLVCPNFEKDDATTSGKSIIHDIFILNLVFWRLWTILTLCSRLDCRIFLIIWFTTPPSQAWTRAYKSFEDYRLFDDRLLRIVSIEVSWHYTWNLTPKRWIINQTLEGRGIEKNDQKLSFTCLLMLFLFPYFSYRITAVCEKHHCNSIPSTANPKWLLFVDYKV